MSEQGSIGRPAPTGTLRRVLSEGRFVVAPGVYEMLSARIADAMDFPALYMTGYGISASHLGVADPGIVAYRDMLKRLEVALDARRSRDFLVIARTDARSALGLDEAIARGRAFARAGADVVFVESPESVEEFRRVGAELAGEGAWLIANMVPSG